MIDAVNMWLGFTLPKLNIALNFMLKENQFYYSKSYISSH